MQGVCSVRPKIELIIIWKCIITTKIGKKLRFLCSVNIESNVNKFWTVFLRFLIFLAIFCCLPLILDVFYQFLTIFTKFIPVLCFFALFKSASFLSIIIFCQCIGCPLVAVQYMIGNRKTN